jgi:hypothetical protein
MGMRRATAFGQTSRVGWLCDLFGHNSQMPQILRLLGIASLEAPAPNSNISLSMGDSSMIIL